ncbi:MAG: ABC-2 type transport system ATP-binding protein [Chloroflexi bacterium]|jgi:ABC-2 type transport system ATP-binding protein|nr:MAG: ABC-2 type transport system ATP-binding protein [Chloroflexota bacterium]
MTWQVPIEFKSVTKSYGSYLALDDMTLTVESGEIFGFLGPNGAGKTTAIRILTGFLNPTDGSAHVFGMNSWMETVNINRRIGFVPDLSSLYDNSTGIELLEYFGSLHGGLNRPNLNTLSDSLKLSHEDLNRKIRQYSHGMKRKLAIIQAMQHQPDLLIMDEPTQGLDPLTQIALFGVLKTFSNNGGTIFFSSHVLSEVENLCERVAIIREGKLIVIEKIKELKSRKRRVAKIRFKNEIPSNFDLQGLTIISRDNNEFLLSIDHNINPFIKFLGNYQVENLSIEEPSLEDIFLDYYQDPNQDDLSL